MTGCCNFFCTCGKIQPVVGHCSYFETFHMYVRMAHYMRGRVPDTHMIRLCWTHGCRDALLMSNRPKRYDIDVRQLERIYWDLQKSLHPDRYGQKSRVSKGK